MRPGDQVIQSLLVIAGCLALLIILFSTVSAHFLQFASCCLALASVIATNQGLAKSKQAATGNVRSTKIAACYARYSSDDQNESSISDQIRCCQEAAAREDLTIPDSRVYRDEAVSGTKLHRTGLDQMLEDAENGRFDVIYFYSLSRLARESVIGMPVLKTLVHRYRVRVVCLQDGVDSANAGWETVAGFFSIIHEQFIRDLSGHVKKGQQGTVLDGFSAGDYRFGYKSIPSPGGEMIRRGGESKPRRIYTIDEEQARWVRQIFDWFVKEDRPIDWIVRELNRQQVPKDHRSTTKQWRHQLVIGVLRSPKYIGIWPWGLRECVRDPVTGQVSQVLRDAEECQRYERELPHLRIVEDDVFALAQQRLDQQSASHRKYRRSKGRLHGSDGKQSRTHLLSRVFCCHECGSTMIVGGGRGKYLVCPAVSQGRCSCKTSLPRELAARLVLDAVGDQILLNPEWQEAIYLSSVEAWKSMQQHQPEQLDQVLKEREKCQKKIQRLVDMIEASETPDPSVGSRLAERRREMTALDQEIRKLEISNTESPAEPTREWVVEQLKKFLHTFLSNTPAANQALLGLLDGPILLSLVTALGRKRPVWRGQLRWNVSRLQQQAIGSVNVVAMESTGQENNSEVIELLFCKPSILDQQVEAVWALLQQRMTLSEIGRKLEIKEARLTVVLKQISERYGAGRSPKDLLREFRPARTKPLAVEQYIVPAMQMYREGKLLSEIAESLQTHRNMITKAIRLGNERDGLPAPDGRHRRKSLDLKSRPSLRRKCMQVQPNGDQFDIETGKPASLQSP